MHAASVHPEPGSNSLKNGIYNSLAEATYRFLELAYLSFLLLFRVSKFVRDSFTRTFVFLPSWCSKFLLFNFQRPIAFRRLAVSFTSIHQSFRFVKRISKLFSLFFASCFFLLSHALQLMPASQRRSTIIMPSSSFVKRFFGFFDDLCTLFAKPRFFVHETDMSTNALSIFILLLAFYSM